MRVVLVWILFSFHDLVFLHSDEICLICDFVFPFFHSPFLTWRDIQHIIVRTSRAGHLNANDWKTNAAGYKGKNLLFSLLSDTTSYLVFLKKKQSRVVCLTVCCA